MKLLGWIVFAIVISAIVAAAAWGTWVLLSWSVDCFGRGCG